MNKKYKSLSIGKINNQKGKNQINKYFKILTYNNNKIIIIIINIA